MSLRENSVGRCGGGRHAVSALCCGGEGRRRRGVAGQQRDVVSVRRVLRGGRVVGGRGGALFAAVARAEQGGEAVREERGERVAGCRAHDGAGEELGGGVHSEGVALVYGEERLEGGEAGNRVVSEREGDEGEIVDGDLCVPRRHSVSAAARHVLLIYFNHLFGTRLPYQPFEEAVQPIVH